MKPVIHASSLLKTLFNDYNILIPHNALKFLRKEFSMLLNLQGLNNYNGVIFYHDWDVIRSYPKYRFEDPMEMYTISEKRTREIVEDKLDVRPKCLR